ncbi:cytidylyltransferase domain-containing protein [Bacteroides ovatus]|uniref:acylneuraminate cytidylyltransferase family protein n=1 Tax=Bacteroides ovatus TaxID=28116 RepID=UPI00202EE95B|nr:acylneuraminate cytidylyltransferase family protein [Bacteroides ovatus]MCM1719092.1 acylneuraminate cytidylyltransferase family protein [Bacteroides ovatus]MCM1755329.1 acylneuraminate cytidylyltransferase family protein [Bacteroides ovatus]MCM1864359.1 acylneuraminate cytidylyltransferase family protein [Bacteroides ovatus]MCM1911219.1 acylneuraminate cytidylyltransferase family protein [Bacteroides ovatus]
MKILVTICARGGSKGIPGKNIKVINGRPLIWYTIQTARQFQKEVEGVDIVLSTDSEEIIKVANECGLKSDYKRPDYLANDTCGKVDAIKDAVLHYEAQFNQKYDYILDMDVTSPLRNVDDLKAALEIFEKETGAINLYSVSPASRNPYFNMVEKKANGFYNLVKDDVLSLSRQTAPVVYEQNASFYFYRREFFDLGYKSTDTDRSTIYLVPHICFDLDNPLDFEIMSFLLEKDKLDFNL